MKLVNLEHTSPIMIIFVESSIKNIKRQNMEDDISNCSED